MILILSRESSEITTDVVIDWLEKYSASYFRFNGEDLLNGKCKIRFYFKNKNWEFEIFHRDIKYKSENFNAVWYRRSFDWDMDDRFWKSHNSIDDYKFLRKFNDFHTKEIKTVYNLIEISLKDRYWLNRPSKSKSEKFKYLEIASQVGFDIPETIVANSKIFITNFINKHKDVITKPSYEGDALNGIDFGLKITTSRINNNGLIKIEKSNFSPSLFQKEIKKEYELRVIFIDNKIFSIAIFSQENKMTELDYRNYDIDKPNKNQRIILPKDIEDKIKQLMEILNINFASIDIIKGKNGKYYFLEVNPVGQFLGISTALNLNLENIIAKKLIEKDEI